MYDKGIDIIILMDCYEKNFQGLLRETTHLSTNEVISIGMDICNALINVHAGHIVHRDIKPEDILISQVGDYVLSDFGISKVVTLGSQSVTKSEIRDSTRIYAAPELFNAKPIDFSYDIYTLGMVLYGVLNDTFFPFADNIKENDEESSLKKRLNKDNLVDSKYLPKPISSSAVTDGNNKKLDDLTKIVLKACAYEKEDRYKSAADMKEDLEEVISNRPLIYAVKNGRRVKHANAGETERANIGNGPKSAHTLDKGFFELVDRFIHDKWLPKITAGVLILILALSVYALSTANKDNPTIPASGENVGATTTIEPSTEPTAPVVLIEKNHNTGKD